MSFDRKSVSWPEVPNPTWQSRVIIEICQNDVNEARATAATNVMFARTSENIDYWSQVDQTLASKDLETLSLGQDRHVREQSPCCSACRNQLESLN